MKAVFVDANDALAAVAESVKLPPGIALSVNRNPAVEHWQLPALLADASVAIIDHTAFPAEIARKCANVRHVVFLGTGARSYMDPEALGALGITVHTIRGYGDTAVAECAFALMWTAARGFARMDRSMRVGRWLRTEGVQLTGKTLGLVGFGGIAAEVARLALGVGMTVVAWNRTPRAHSGVEFLPLEQVLARSDVVSLHLLLTDETRGFLSRDRIAAMRPGSILINTARGAVVDERAMVEALRYGHIGHAGLDVFVTEPLPPGHDLVSLDNVTLSAHSAFRTQEANHNLMAAAVDHCGRILAEGGF